MAVFMLYSQQSIAATGTWTKVATNAPHANMGVMLLLTDGTVICHNSNGGTYGTGWDKLTPDASGSYINGTWTSIASMNNDRLFFPTQVMPNGQVFCAGGEYGPGGTKGEYYDPVANKWTLTGAITGGPNVYDGNSEILPNGQVLVGDQLGSNPSYNCLYYNIGTNAWAAAPSSPLNHDEAQWLKLPDSSILFVGIASTKSCRFIPQTSTWVNDANLPVSLYDTYGEEAGSAFMLPDGRAMFLGATGHNAFYTPSGNTTPGTWAAAPDFPTVGGVQVGTPDASAAMMPNGKILCAVSPIGTSASDEFRAPTYFFEFDYTTNTFTQVTSNFPTLGVDSLAGVACYQTCMLDLPDGTVLLGINQSSISNDYFVYTPVGAPLASGKPTIRGLNQSSCPTYQLYGTGFNGICEGAAYGDDWQMATNYPIIRLTLGGNVYYAKTTLWNRVGAVMTDSAADTCTFTLPAGMPNGTYSLVVIANGNPSSPTTLTLPCSPCLPITVTPTNTPVKCNGGSTGTASATAVGGTLPYTYLWTPGGNTSSNATGLSAGTYTITVTDKNGCTGSASTTITQPTALTAAVTTNPATCGSSNGSATVTASGGTITYTYLWAPSGNTSSNATGLSSGSYTVTVTDKNGCTVTASGTVTSTGGPTITISSQTNVACFGGKTGSINTTTSGGTSPYTYLWTPGGQTTANITGLSATTYTVTVTDKNGCVATASATITQPASALTVSTGSITNVKCTGSSTGSATATASGGTVTYTYLWAPGGNTSSNATGLSAGTYTVTVTDKNGCTATANAVITQPATALSVTTTTTTTTCGGSTGTAKATPAGGTGAYTYAWAPGGQTNQTATGLSAGTYTVTVTDANGCTATATATVTVSGGGETVTISSVTNVKCNGGNTGSLGTTVTGGTAPYTYLWTPGGQTGSNATGLSAGTYTITVTDKNGCVATASATITQPTALTVTVATTSANCGASNGSATATASGGTTAYTYLWTPTSITSSTATGLSAGSYTVTVTDANGCTATASGSVTNLGGPTITISSQTNVACFGGKTGSINTTTSGGTSPYTYSWAPSGQTTANITGLSATTYTVTVTDKNGCIATASTTITQPASALSVVATNTPVKCNGGNTGTATATASGGTVTYTYAWTPGGQTSSTASGLTAGTYTITVTDKNGCVVTASTTITQAPVLTATISGSTNVSCNGGSDGTATVTAGGGASPYAYLWTPGGNNNSNATGLSAGTYTVTVTDNNGCTATASVTLTQPPPMTVTPSAPTICSGSNVILTASGATTYVWSPGTGLSATTGATVTASPTVTTSYTVTGTTGACVTTATVVVKVNPSPNITLTPPSLTLCSGDSATITASGATTYTWAPAAGLSNTTGLIVTAFPSATTTYTVTGTLGTCTSTQTITVTVNPTPTVTVSPSAPAPFCSGGSVLLTASGATTYAWSPATGLSSTSGAAVTASPTVTTSYTVTGTKGTCSNIATVVVTVNPTPTVNVTPGSATICNGGSGTSITASGATSYNWAPAAGLSATTGANVTANPTVTTTYTVTGTTGTCSAMQTVTITVDSAPVVSVIPAAPVICSGSNTTLTASGATTYTWSPATGLSATTGSVVTASPTVTTSYTVTGSNGGCTGTAIVVVTVNPSPNVTVTPTSATICSSGPGTNLTASGAASYTWKPAAGLSATTGSVVTATPTVTTTYTVIGDNPLACKDSVMVTITVDSAVTPTISGKDTLCKGDSTTLTATGGGTYKWSNGATTSSITVNPNSTTTYSVTVKNGVCSGTSSVKVTVNTAPTPTITQSGDTLWCMPTGMTYQWYMNGNPIVGSTSDSLHITTTGTYKVMITTPEGCSDTADDIVTGLAGVDEISLSQFINVYPNPTTGNIRIECNVPEGNYRMTLTDVLGQVLYTDNVYITTRYTGYMNISNYASGMYILTIKGVNSITEKKVLLNK